MGKDFEIFDHTADIGIIAYGTDVRQAFTSAARGLFSLIVELDEITVQAQKDIQVTAPDREALLVNWLNELIYIVDTEEMLFKDFEIVDLSETEIKAKAYGEKIDTGKLHPGIIGDPLIEPGRGIAHERVDDKVRDLMDDPA